MRKKMKNMMSRIFILLSIVINLSFNFKIVPSLASVDYIFIINTQGQSTVPIKNQPSDDATTIHQMKDKETITSCSQCDRETSFYDSDGNLWWEVWYLDPIVNQEKMGYMKDKYLLFRDGGGCVNEKPADTQTPSACFGK